MYLISEVAKIIGVTRQSIYKKIDRENLQGYTIDTEKGKAINEEGLNVLKDFFKEYVECKRDTVNTQTPDSKQADNLQYDFTADYISSLKAEIEHLKGIVSDQSQQNSNLTRLLENSQVLLKQQQEKILLLEEPKEVKTFWDKISFWKS